MLACIPFCVSRQGVRCSDTASKPWAGSTSCLQHTTVVHTIQECQASGWLVIACTHSVQHAQLGKYLSAYQEPELQHEDPLQPAPHHRSCASTATQCGAQPMVATAAVQAGYLHSEHQQQTERPDSSYSLPESLVEAAIKELEGQADRYFPS